MKKKLRPTNLLFNVLSDLVYGKPFQKLTQKRKKTLKKAFFVREK